MKKIKNHFLNNNVFYIIIILTLLASFVNYNIAYIGENPFVSKYFLENPAQAVFADGFHYYLTDSSYTIAVTDGSDRLIYVIEGGNAENTFDYADAVITGNDGALYVHDKSYQDDGVCAYRERILKFTENGKRREVLYEVQTVGEDGEQILYLDSPKYINNVLYFSEITENGVCVKGIIGNNAEEFTFMPLSGANDLAADSSFNNDLDISVVLMNGDIYTFENGENKLLYCAREYDTDEYCSLITEIAYGDTGILYANDTGQRRILSVSSDKVICEIEKGYFDEERINEFASYPIYTGLNVYGDTISVLSSEYSYDSATDESDYFYYIAAADRYGNRIFYGNEIGISIKRRILILSVYAAILLIVCIAVLTAFKLASIIRNTNISQIKTQFLILVTAIAVTFSVSVSVFQSGSERFSEESASNLANIAYLIDASIDKEIVKSIDSPDAYFEKNYKLLDDGISDILKSGVNADRNVYAVIYKVYNNVICEIYRNDFYHGVMYPMAGSYRGSIEESIAENKSCYISQDYELSEGSYTFSLIPSYDTSGNLTAFIEVGTDYNYFVQENNRLFKKLLLTSSMAVIIIMLLFSEFMNGVSAFRAKKNCLERKAEKSPEVIRPIAFLIFFTANITTAFLPIYGTSVWNEDFPLPVEIAAAFPISAELIFSALSAFLSGFAIKKAGIKSMCIIGAAFYLIGNLISAFAFNLWILIGANGICGIGGGMLTIAVNTWITGFKKERQQNKGFVHYNAAYLSGMNCGTVIGAMIWENYGTKAAYVTAAGCTCLIVLCVLFLIEKREISDGKVRKKEPLALRSFVTPGILRYFICLAIPYLICASFLSYYFPIIAEQNLLSASEISMAFLISGVISIYAGSSIGEAVINRLGVKKAMVFASSVYAAALLYLAVRPCAASCYAVIAAFAAADSFGLSALSVYFISMPEVKKLGESRALGIDSTIESIASASGSVIFGAALLAGERIGILMIGSIFAALLLIFIIGGKLHDAKSDTSRNQRYSHAEKNMA